MAAKKRVETWYALKWQDEAGRGDQMVGPKYALEAKAKELKNAGTEYTFEECGWAETPVQYSLLDELETRGEN